MPTPADIAASKVLPEPATRRQIRIDSGLTIRELARAVGCSKESIIKWEQGKRDPKGDLRTNYAKALCELEAFLRARP